MATVATDADLVRRHLAGDRRALAEIYERYGDRVYDLCFAMLSSGDDAADAYQDTFLTAAQKLGQLRDPDRLRSWLYSVARNQCRARLRHRKRTTPDEDAGVDVGVEVDMTTEMARSELRELMAEAGSGLNDRDREVLELHMRHELEGEELADALGVSVQNAYKLVQRVRDRVERSLGALLVARHARRECPELDELLAEWDGQFSPLMRKRIGRHVDECETCTQRRAGLMDPGGLAGAYPLQPVPDALRTRLQAAIEAGAAPSHEIPRWDGDGFPGRPRRGPKLLAGVVAAGVLFLGGVAGGLAFAEVLDDSDVRLETVAAPAEAESAAPETETPATTTSTTTVVTTTTAPPPPAPSTSTTTTTVPSPAAPTTAPPTTAPPTTAAPTTAPPTTAPPTTAPPTTAPPSTTTTSTTTTSTTTTTAPDANPPRIRSASHSPAGTAGFIHESNPGAPCSGAPGGTSFTVTVTADDDIGVTGVDMSWVAVAGSGSGSGALVDGGGGSWAGTFRVASGSVDFATEIAITVTVRDTVNATSATTSNAMGNVVVFPCP